MGDSQLSTGLPGLDRVLRGLIPGDNVVWQIDSVADYAPLVQAFCAYARAKGRKLIYFRFGDHKPLVAEDTGIEICRLDVAKGFEQFITAIHRAVSRAGRGAYLVFDCLSTLAVDWNSDRMLGNFFMLTCPYILDLESLAYFAVLRGCHSFHATTPIAETTQIFLDVYRHQGQLYVQPIKVQHRYSPTMYMLHAWKGCEFVPVMESSTTAEVLTALPWGGKDSVRLRLGVWNRRFLEAEEVWVGFRRGQRSTEEVEQHLQLLLRTIISRDDRVLELAAGCLNLGDVLAVGKRMIGTGLIGGKTVGMLLARAILRGQDSRWTEEDRKSVV
jgi:pyruvate, water dikinase